MAPNGTKNSPANPETKTADVPPKLTPGRMFYQDLIQEASRTPGDQESKDDVDLVDSDWFRPDLIEEGKEFFRRNYFSVIFSHIIALLWVFTFKAQLPVLLQTGNSHQKQESLIRYLSTALHLTLWYEGDLINNLAGGSKDVISVRKTHALAVKNFRNLIANQDFKAPDANLTPKLQKFYRAWQQDMTSIDDSQVAPYVLEDVQCHMSQLDLVVTQFSFIGLLARNTEAYGIKDRRGLDAFVHKWAVLGKLLGIHDRFNVAIHCLRRPGTFADNTKDMEVLNLIFDQVYFPSLKFVPEISLQMIECMAYGLSKYTVWLTSTSLVHFTLRDVVGIENPAAVRSVMDIKDRLSLLIVKLVIYLCLKWDVTRKFVNFVLRRLVDNGARKYVPARFEQNLEAMKPIRSF